MSLNNNDSTPRSHYMHAPVIRRLGHRLHHIFEWVQQEPAYNDIWDLCCDHGRLGLHLHQRNDGGCIYLVDRIPSIIEALKSKYTILCDGKLFFCLQDAGAIQLTSASRQLIVIAGLGGENIVEILNGIGTRLHHEQPSPINQSRIVDLILSPNSHTFALRRFLARSPFELIKEAFVEDKGHYHEHIFLRLTHNTPTRHSDVGEEIWQPFTATKRRYIERLIAHYAHVLAFKHNPLAEDAKAAYTSLLTRHIKHGNESKGPEES